MLRFLESHATRHAKTVKLHYNRSGDTMQQTTALHPQWLTPCSQRHTGCVHKHAPRGYGQGTILPWSHQAVHRTTSSTFVVFFLSDVTCIVVSYIGLMLVDMGKVQYCHGHTRQCTTPPRRFSSVFCTTDVKCIALSYVCRIYAGHILVSSLGRIAFDAAL
jgi:hypothetical protein